MKDFLSFCIEDKNYMFFKILKSDIFSYKKISSIFFLLIFFFAIPFFVFAVDDKIQLSAVKTYVVDENLVLGGDIISYNKDTNTYILSRTPSSEKMFGVVVENPLLVFEKGEGKTPIINTGVSQVNVIFNEGEKIHQGDMITSSSLPGKGKKAEAEDKYVLGVANEEMSFNEAGNLFSFDGEDYIMGKIDVNISIGSKSGLASRLKSGGPEGFNEATVTNIIQYSVAAIIALGSLYIAFRNFMPNLQKGIISMGRNPRASTSIKSMVVFNSVVVVLIALGGFLIGFLIIWLPI